jgi:uncharacterized protein YndB with AHSA1/START domain
MNEKPVIHKTFTIERTFKQPPSRVFAAYADPVKKCRWFAEGEGWVVEQFDVDFRVNGHETSRFRFRDGPPISNDTVITDIVPDQRIIVAYTMAIDGKRISSSLGTTELVASGSGTKLVYTEQGAYLGGEDGSVDRESGCRELLEALARELDAHAA